MISEATALSAVAATVGLTLCRPQIGGLTVGPALAAAIGLVLMATVGHIDGQNVAEAANILWRPLIAVASIMLIASSR